MGVRRAVEVKGDKNPPDGNEQVINLSSSAGNWDGSVGHEDIASCTTVQVASVSKAPDSLVPSRWLLRSPS
jgi:hypothetical protein